MNNEADNGYLDSAQILEWQNGSEATPLELTSAGLGGDQTGSSQNFPIMLFETQTDGAVGPVITRPDRLIYHER